MLQTIQRALIKPLTRAVASSATKQSAVQSAVQSADIRTLRSTRTVPRELDVRHGKVFGKVAQSSNDCERSKLVKDMLLARPEYNSTFANLFFKQAAAFIGGECDQSTKHSWVYKRIFKAAFVARHPQQSRAQIDVMNKIHLSTDASASSQLLRSAAFVAGSLLPNVISVYINVEKTRYADGDLRWALHTAALDCGIFVDELPATPVCPPRAPRVQAILDAVAAEKCTMTVFVDGAQWLFPYKQEWDDLRALFDARTCFVVAAGSRNPMASLAEPNNISVDQQRKLWTNDNASDPVLCASGWTI